MNPCQLTSFDGGLCLQSTLARALEPFWWVQYWPWALGAIALLAALWGLAKVKELFGQTAVDIILVFAVGALEYSRGKKGLGPIPFQHEMLPPGHVDAAPAKKRR